MQCARLLQVRLLTLLSSIEIATGNEEETK